MEDYKMFIAPEELAQKGSLNWTKKEAESYFNWFIGIKESRIRYFIDFFNLVDFTPTKDKFVKLYHKLDVLLATNKYSHDSSEQYEGFYKHGKSMDLTDRGYSVGADLGLWIYSVVESESSFHFTWSINTKKKFHNTNMPVVTNKIGLMKDPIDFGIIQCQYILNSTEVTNAELFNVYQSIYNMNI